MRLLEIFYIAFLLLAIGSYIGNGVKLINCDFEAPYKEEVVYGIGVVAAPLSLITVWYNK